MDNDCPVCEGRKKIITRDYRDCERDEPCPHCSEDPMSKETTAELLERMATTVRDMETYAREQGSSALAAWIRQHLDDIRALRERIQELEGWRFE